MKGFIHLIEVAVSGILIMIVLGLFFTSQTVELNWERTELISANSNILDTLKASGSLSNIFSNTSDVLDDINDLKQPNIEYGIRVSGVPEDIIEVACPKDCSYVRKMLADDVYVNNRRLTFDVDSVSMADVLLNEYKNTEVLPVWNFKKKKEIEQNKEKLLLGDING